MNRANVQRGNQVDSITSKEQAKVCYCMTTSLYIIRPHVIGEVDICNKQGKGASCMRERQGKGMYEKCKVDTCLLEVKIDISNEKENDTCRQQLLNLGK